MGSGRESVHLSIAKSNLSDHGTSKPRIVTRTNGLAESGQTPGSCEDRPEPFGIIYQDARKFGGIPQKLLMASLNPTMLSAVTDTIVVMDANFSQFRGILDEANAFYGGFERSHGLLGFGAGRGPQERSTTW